MKNKKLLISAINLILIAAGAALSVILLVTAKAVLWQKLSAFCGLVTAVFAFYYMFIGGLKNAAVYFKTYGALLSLDFAIGTVTAGVVTDNAATLFFGVFALAVALYLFSSKDLGKKRSYIISGVLLAVSVFMTLSPLLEMNMSDNLFRQELLRTSSLLVFSVLYCGMIVVKYADKEQRKSQKQD